jgi:hypothetical protein
MPASRRGLQKDLTLETMEDVLFVIIKEFIFFPFGWIIYDVIRDIAIGYFIPYNMIVKGSLPCKIRISQ